MNTSEEFDVFLNTVGDSDFDLNTMEESDVLVSAAWLQAELTPGMDCRHYV
jgi:hypothetical protein